MSAIIRRPQEGDAVTYYPPVHGDGPSDPVAATIIKVWGDHCVNLDCADGARPTSVFLLHAGAERPSGYYCVLKEPEPEPEAKPPRTVTMQGILDKVVQATYTLLPNGRTTVCQLTMQNGFTIEGQSACVDAAKYNRHLGEKYAYEDALNKVWPFEGYLLAEKIYTGQ